MKKIFLNIYFWFKATLGALQSQKSVTFENAIDQKQLLTQLKEDSKDISVSQEQIPMDYDGNDIRMSFRAKISKKIHDLYSNIILKKYERRVRQINNIQPGDKVRIKWMKDLAEMLPKAKVDKIVFNLYVKQPIPGMSIKMTLATEVGHTFIGLKLFGKSSNDIIKHVFGYYPSPDRHKLLSGTPFENKAESCFMDDAKHEYHVKISKEITLDQHIKILDLASKFEQNAYDLRNNNCTDFGIESAKLADIVIHKTSGDWVIGEGNNPADLGQALLYGLFYNKATKSKEGIIIDKKKVEKELDGMG